MTARLLMAALLVSALAIDSGAAPAPFQAGPAVPNLAGYWKLDETTGTTAADSSGNGNTGTHANGPVISTALPTMANYACNQRSLTFPYVTGGPYKIVDVPDSASLSIAGSVTCAAWIRTAGAGLDAMAQPVQQGIIEKWDGPLPAHDGYYLRLTQTLMLSWNICPPSGGPIGITTAPRAIAVNTWTHVAGTYDAATGNMTMYVNGAPDATFILNPVPIPAPPGNGTSNLQLGADYGSNQFNGEIDEARVYNRVLTQTEIQTLMAGQAPPTALAAVPGPGQVALTWTPGAGSTSTNLYRATAAAGPYALLAGVAGSSYTDLTAVAPNTYYYQATAVSVMESCPTAAVSAAPQPTTPRTNDHPNGDQCGCGSASARLPAGPLALAALLLLSVVRIRRI